MLCLRTGLPCTHTMRAGLSSSHTRHIANHLWMASSYFSVSIFLLTLLPEVFTVWHLKSFYYILVAKIMAVDDSALVLME